MTNPEKTLTYPDDAPTFPHPYPQYHLMQDELQQMVPHRELGQRDTHQPDATHGTVPLPYEAEMSSQRWHRDTYPHLMQRLFVAQGVDAVGIVAGGARAMVLDTTNIAPLGGAAGIWIPELAKAFVVGFNQGKWTINFPGTLDNISFQWFVTHAPLVFAGVTQTVGCWATVELYDAWLPQMATIA